MYLLLKLTEYSYNQYQVGQDFEFYSREKRHFFNVLKIALNQEIEEFDSSGCTLNDLFLGLTEGGLE